MFAVETLPPQYYEERAAAEAAKRLAEQQAAAALQAQTYSPTAAQQSTPSSLQHALYPQATLSRPGSSTVLGGIFQSFMKRAPSSPMITPAQTPMRTETPTSHEEQSRQHAHELIAKLRKEEDAKRDTDIASLIAYRSDFHWLLTQIAVRVTWLALNSTSG